jgi:hypothetical protein
MELNRHSRLVLLSVCIAAVTTSTCAAQQNTAPGATDTEIKIGQTMAYSGPASAWVQLAEPRLPTSR